MDYKPGFTTKQSAFPFCFMSHVSRKVIFQKTFLPNFSLSLLVLSLSISVSVCVISNYFFTLLSPALTPSVLQLFPFFPFSFPLNSSFLFTLNVCLHILMLTALYCALRFPSEMPKISFSLCLRKSCLLMFHLPVCSLAPQPFLSSFP